MNEELGLSPHDLAMVNKVDAASAAFNPVGKETAAPVAPVVTERPAHIPEKFWDAATGSAKVDDMARSYAELERVRSQGAPAAPTDPAAAIAASAAAAAGDAGAGVDFVGFTNEFATTGKLAESSYAALAAKGLSKGIVDEFIASKAAAAEAVSLKEQLTAFQEREAVAEVHSLAGGEQPFQAMLNWAAVNLKPADQTAFDNAMSGDSATRKQAVVALKAQYAAVRGSDPVLISGDGKAINGSAFQSRAEVTAAMRDPRYRSDPAYRADVERRLGAMAVF